VSLKSGHFENEIRVSGHTMRPESPPASPLDPGTPAAPEPQQPAAPEEEPVVIPETPLEEDTGGCAAAPGSTVMAAGLLLWLLRRSRRPRTRG
jgi:hypothetical protein